MIQLRRGVVIVGVIATLLAVPSSATTEVVYKASIHGKGIYASGNVGESAVFVSVGPVERAPSAPAEVMVFVDVFQYVPEVDDVVLVACGLGYFPPSVLTAGPAGGLSIDVDLGSLSPCLDVEGVSGTMSLTATPTKVSGSRNTGSWLQWFGDVFSRSTGMLEERSAALTGTIMGTDVSTDATWYGTVSTSNHVFVTIERHTPRNGS
jgi:hypothetical protein